MENYEKKLDALCGLSILLGGLIVIASFMLAFAVTKETSSYQEMRGTYEEHLEEDAQQIVEAVFNICGFKY